MIIQNTKIKKEDMFQPKHRVSRKHTISTTPKYDPDAHLARRDKDEEDSDPIIDPNCKMIYLAHKNT